MNNEYGRIGAATNGLLEVFELVTSDFIPTIAPPPGLGLSEIDPTAYFITSGDAIRKTEQLYRDLMDYNKMLQQMIGENGNPELLKFDIACANAMLGCLRMKKALEDARGKAIFLETEWYLNHLLVHAKNPRLKK